MRKLLTAVLAALTLVGAGFMAAPPATAAGSHDGYYGRDRYDDRYRDHRYDDRRYDRGRRGYDRYDRGDHRRDSRWWRHVRRCERAYRSYNRRTDMYLTRYGWRRCRL